MDSLVWLVILMGSYTMAAGLSSMVKIDSQREKACNPRMGNIALGRSVWTETTCGYNSTEVYCTYRENPEQICTEPKCDKCNSALPRLSHPPSAMGDSTFKIPRTWWQSARGIQTEIIRLDLETEFYFTHLIMVFKSPRPAAMILERSQDFGATWRPYKFFATNCSETFALEDDVTEKGALCTSRYSQAFPCSGGEVIYRAMSPPYSTEDPYSEEAQDQLKITNLRVQLLKQQICPCQSKDPEIKPQYLAHYAVYDFIVKGSCFCNGHADHCVPVDGFQQTRTTSKLQVISLACCYAIRVWNGNPGRPIISGIGTLTENICGWVENTLKPLVKQTPSFLQDTTDLLNKLADLGPIPESTILATMDVESLYTNIPHTDGIAACQGYRTQKDRKVHGRCLCKHNTVGAHCELCAPLYNDQPWQAANGNTGASNTCKKCKCNGHANSCHFDLDLWLASGNRSGGVCDNCQHNTEGHHCQRCKPGFFRDLNIPFSKPDACKACSCHAVGSAVLPYSSNAICDPSNGDCPCKPGVAGPHCDRCMVGYWGFGEYGCRPCDCARSCDPLTGDCITMDIDWHRDIPHLLPVYNDSGRSWDWEDEQGFSALRYPGKCECKEQVLGNPKVFCGMKYSYVLKTKILSAHDRGSHAEVNVKIKKVLKMTKLKIVRGKRTLYPESWTSRGCTCPILNPGLEYLVAGYEDLRTGRLIVNMKSFVQLWKPSLGKKVVEILKQDCK